MCVVENHKLSSVLNTLSTEEQQCKSKKDHLRPNGILGSRHELNEKTFGFPMLQMKGALQVMDVQEFTRTSSVEPSI